MGCFFNCLVSGVKLTWMTNNHGLLNYFVGNYRNFLTKSKPETLNVNEVKFNLVKLDERVLLIKLNLEAGEVAIHQNQKYEGEVVNFTS